MAPFTRVADYQFRLGMHLQTAFIRCGTPLKCYGTSEIQKTLRENALTVILYRYVVDVAQWPML